MKKMIAIFLAAMSVLCLFAGCGSTNSAGGSGNEDALQVAVLEGTCTADVWQKVCDAFEDQTGIEIQLTVCKNADELASVKADVVHSGSPSDVTEQLIKGKKLYELNNVLAATIPGETVTVADKIANGFLDTSVTMPYGDGKTYLAPMFQSPWGLFYNAKLFETKRWNVPTTWDEMWELAEDALAVDMYLFAYYDAEDMESFINALMYSVGGADFYTAVVNGEEGVWESKEARNFVKILDRLAKYTHPEFMGLEKDSPEYLHLVIHQDALFVPNNTRFTSEMTLQVQSISNGTFAWGMTSLPATSPEDDAYSYCEIEQIWIPADAAKKSEAEQFIAFLYSNKATELFAAKGAVQPIKGISAIVNGASQRYYALFDNGAKAALATVEVNSALINSFNQLVDGTIKSSDFLENMKAAAAQ